MDSIDASDEGPTTESSFEGWSPVSVVLHLSMSTNHTLTKPLFNLVAVRYRRDFRVILLGRLPAKHDSQ